MSRLARVLLTLIGVVAAACAPQPAAPDAPTPDAAAEARLVSSLQVARFADSVVLTLQVTNVSQAPVELTFPTGQSFDFVVEQDGREVWRWSGDRAFVQVIRTEVLAPGQTERFEAAWRPAPGVPAGDFTAIAFLTAQEHRAEQRARFRLP